MPMIFCKSKRGRARTADITKFEAIPVNREKTTVTHVGRQIFGYGFYVMMARTTSGEPQKCKQAETKLRELTGATRA